ncbi:hypothetical protein MMC14_010388 [Varicellaria rhodocarpa]|nr:hypothetical protein [Varicellaria rhodocarpa]
MSNSAQTILQACADGNLQSLKSLLTNPVEPQSGLSFPRTENEQPAVSQMLTEAASHSQSAIIEYILATYTSVPFDEEIVRATIYSGSIPLFSTLLEKDPSIINKPFDMRGTPLAVAVMSQTSPLPFLRFLLTSGADPNQDPDTLPMPLALAARLYESTDVVALLLKHGAHVPRSGALAAAASGERRQTIDYLLAHGASPQDDDPRNASGPRLAPAFEIAQLELAQLSLA